MNALRTISLLALLFLASQSFCDGFAPSKQQSSSRQTTALAATSRRDLFHQATSAAAAATALVVGGIPQTGWAVEDATAIAAPPIDMKLFVDPKGLFSIIVPSRFFKLRRTEKGDLPDEKTGKGRRGSSIFTAGDLAKAEVIAVERFPTKVLLEENGIEATGDLSTFPALGESFAIANLINLRREREKTGNTMIFPDSVTLSDDKKEIQFRMKTEIEVQKPELLMETYGVRQLFRLTSAKATLNSNDGNIMAVFASALEQDFTGRDGEALEEAVRSFRVTDQSSSTAPN